MERELLAVLAICILQGAFAEIVSSPVAIVDGEAVTVAGSGFGTRERTAPWRSSYGNPIGSMNFQETGEFSSAYWTLTGPIMISFGEGRVNGKEYVRLEYSARGNSEGYTAGVNTNLGFSQRRKHYISWWDYYEPGFAFWHMSTGASDFKWIYISPGGTPHMALAVSDNGTTFHDGVSGGVAGTTAEEQRKNLICPFGGGFYARPISWHAAYPIKTGEWYFAEIIEDYSTAPGIHDGWREFRINNERVFFANNTDIYPSGTAGSPVYGNIRFGGNYGFDSSGVTQYRYFGDIFIDDSFSRAVICEEPVYSDCRHIEVQVPVAWSDTSITFVANRGSFSVGEEVYLHIIDDNNMPFDSVPMAFSSNCTCAGKECGPDSCGGSCGSCQGQYACHSGLCCHKSDTDLDGCVEDPELIAFIGRWKASSTDASMMELLEAIKTWKEGCG